MSDILIKGMEMPKEGTVIAVYKIDGKLYATRGLSGRLFPLVPVPPHGRLIDADALKAKAIERSEKCGMCVNVLDKVITAYDIETAPTIIPADPAEEGGT